MSTPNSIVTARTDTDGDTAEQSISGGGRAAESGLRVVHAMPAAAPDQPATPAGDHTVAASGPGVGTPQVGSAAGADTVQTSPDSSRAQVWLPVAEAAERTSVSESALRKWIKAGELATREAPGPRGLRTEVTVEAVVARAKLAGIDASPRAGLDLADAFTRLENLTGQLVGMSERAARAEVERDHLKRRLEEIKAEQASALDAERKRSENERARTDALTADLAGSREALTAERARADAMLAAVPRRKRHLFDRPASGVPGHTVGAPGGTTTAR